MKTKDFKHWLAINGIDSRDHHGTIIIEGIRVCKDTSKGEIVWQNYILNMVP